MSVTRSYAKALYETTKALSNGDGVSALSKTLSEQIFQMDEFLKLLKGSKSLRIALMSPATSSKEKTGIICEISARARFPKLLQEFLCLLARKGRLSILSEILSALEEVRLEAVGGILGKLVSADSIAQPDIEALVWAFSKKLGKRVEFQVATDPSLLAGLKVMIQGVTYDGTLRCQLQKLRERMIFS